MADWESLRHAYVSKNEELDSYGWVYTTPLAFYMNLFREGCLQDAGCPNGDGRPNALALEICGTKREDGRRRSRIRRHTLTDGFPELQAILDHSRDTSSFCFMSPVSYFGKARTARNARFLHAFAVDLDGVGPEQCERVVWWNRLEGWFGQICPATYIVNSGTGLHLYYVLQEPVPLIPRNVPGLQLLKRHLTNRLWTEDTSLYADRQYQGIYQGFRMPGTSTKLNGAPGTRKRADYYEAVAWQNPDGRLVTIEDLMAFVPDAGKRSELDELRTVMATAGRTPIEEARVKWPEWYERRVVKGAEKGSYLVKRDLYDWWLGKVRKGAAEHHRYWCLFALASYANKCGVGREELEQDAFDLLPFLQGMDSPGNEFTEDDVMAALDAYEDGAAGGRSRRYTRAFLERKTGIDMPARKRNGLTRAENLEVARTVRDIRQRRNGSHWYDNGGRPKGSKNKAYPKRDAILAYAAAHPGATQREIAAALGMSKTTVNKWLREREGGLEKTDFITS